MQIRVITSGAAGSKRCPGHGAFMRKRRDFRRPSSSSTSRRQPEVAENLLMDAAAGAEMIYRERYEEYGRTLADLRKRYYKREGVDPYLIPVGGSSPVGALGFVNAGFELRGQIEAGEVPEPKAIYVPLGTMGTAAGLLLGLRAAGLAARLVGVRVTPASLANTEKFGSSTAGQTSSSERSIPPFLTCAIPQATFSSAMTTLSRGTALRPNR